MKFKEVTRIKDRLSIQGQGISGAKRGGFIGKDGKPVDPKLIAKAYGITVKEAEALSRRLSL